MTEEHGIVGQKWERSGYVGPQMSFRLVVLNLFDSKAHQDISDTSTIMTKLLILNFLFTETRSGKI